MPGRTHAVLTALALLAALVAPVASVDARSSAHAAPGPSPTRIAVPNGGFESSTAGWVAATPVRLRLTTGFASARALEITPRATARRGRRPGPTVVRSARPVSDAAPAGSRYSWTVRLRGGRTGLRGRLLVREVLAGRELQARAATVRLVRGRWTRAEVQLTRRHARSVFRVQVGSPRQRVLDVLHVDDVTGTRLSSPSAPPASPPVGPPLTPDPEPDPEPDPTSVLSNGCAVSARGIPACGAYLGSAYGSNTDPVAMEQETGRRLGVHRVYYRGDQVNAAVAMARKDVAAGRLPWVSFKLPHSWEAMAAGAGDAWALDLATRMGALPGPVWLAFHHEPETDGDIQAWRRMQERLSPIVRGASENLAFTVILTGWHQLYGSPQYRLDAIWPRVEVDVAGFDVYEGYGVVKNGVTTTRWTELRTAYFEKLATWASTVGVRWAIAETGFTDTASVVRPHWVRDTYADLRATGGIAFTYFNTTLNSIAPWHLGTQTKVDSYREAAVDSPLLPVP